MSPEWVSAVAESISAAAILVLVIQLHDARKQMRADHERSRRQLANEHLLVWTNSLSRSTSSARKLSDLLDEQQCIRLVAEQPLEISSAHRSLVEACLVNHPELAPVPVADSDATIKLSGAQSAEIRHLVVKYLNTLETVLTGWRHHISDEAIVGEEFRYLLLPKEGHKFLKLFRQALGEEFYPAILAFEEHLVQESKPRQGKGQIA